MAAEVAHALLLLSQEHAAVLMSLHPGNAPSREIGWHGVQPELAHAARGLFGQLGELGPSKVLLCWVPDMGAGSSGG